MAWLSLAAVASLAGGLALSAFVPIYTDEIAWRVMQARVGLDGLADSNLYPTCGPAFDVAPPAFTLPFRLAAGMVYADFGRPWRLRAIGIAVALVWLAMLAALLPRALGWSPPGWRLVGAVAGVLGLGLVPFLLVLNRPEQLMLVVLTGLVLYPSTGHAAGPRAPGTDWAVAAAAVGLAALLLEEHPKSVLYLPVVLVAIWLSVRRLLPRLVAAA